MRKKIIFAFIIIFLLLSSNLKPGYAQDTTTLPTYIVQPGETLTLIAQKFNTTVEEIISVNGIVNANLISAGTELYIPGLEGISGELQVTSINLGENLHDLAKRNNIDFEVLLRLNKITSPNEIYVGTNVIVPSKEEASQNYVTAIMDTMDTPLEIAVKEQVNPWILMDWNEETNSSSLLPGRSIYAAIPEEEAISSISAAIRSIEISPLPIEQGNTIVIKVIGNQAVELTGQLDTHPLHFFPFADEENTYYAIQGIHAMAEPGLVNLNLIGNSNGEALFTYDQMLLQQEGIFIKDPPLYVQDETVNPAATEPENDFVLSLVSQITPDKYWQGNFRYPVDGSVEDDTIGFMSTYGNRRSYNGSDYTFFHTGLDFGVFVNSLNIYAPADGVVVYTGNLTVRGGATFIDHGQGIFSGYFHQQDIQVNVGDRVQAGQLIGLIGATGRVTGPHLHWEIWANGVQVNPVDWVTNSYP